ncbi:hypothetical protein NQ314_021045 [Rhamnusium bicolor]|uniref:Uncharacterized protein n=1 Tax=Rhamnusium bicolor TaxID=1586634 RepID=A0AAV8WIM5_9CUCU|nr:hypothetical protein NQ314_021045 [Rhamnusium bicolor]
MYYTIRSLIPEMYEDKHPCLPHMQETFDMFYITPLPKPTKDLYRVIVMKIMAEPDDFDVDNFLGHLMNIIEVKIQEDVALGDVYLIDYVNFKMGHVVKMTPMHIRRAATAMEEILPKDYGGDEKSLQEINELWKQKMGEYKDRFDKLDVMRVKEELRPAPLKNNDILGYHGNFKKLDVD